MAAKDKPLDDAGDDLKESLGIDADAFIIPDKQIKEDAEDTEKDRFTIIIHKDANDPTSLVVNGGVNGVNYSIKRGVKVRVSKAILESLENAKGKAYYQNGDEMQESDVSSYAISVLG